MAKKPDSNSNYGNSADFPIQEGQPRVIYRNSKSIFSAAQKDAATNGGAGLSHANSAHQFLYFNGRKNQPHVFANLVRNADKEDVRTMYADVSRFNGKRFSHVQSDIIEKLTRNNRRMAVTSKSQVLKGINSPAIKSHELKPSFVQKPRADGQKA